MILDPERIAKRKRLVLAGLYLSKYDLVGLRRLGFQSFAEAYNVIGYALGSQPASIKNYRDEFDPLFPNRRRGWHKRPIRDYCEEIFKEYQRLDIELFTGLIKSFVGYDENLASAGTPPDRPDDGAGGFAKRLITGLAAERYFESIQPTLPQFEGYETENTTRLGCGYDFRLSKADSDEFFVVEVKGLRGQTGSIQLTPREFEVASEVRDRFCLFIVKNFQRSPVHEIFLNPTSGRLQFTRIERVAVQVSWMTRV